MIKRSFKLLYVLSMLGIAAWMPLFVLFGTEWSEFTVTWYKAKCASNGKYVTLVGRPAGEAYVWSTDYENDAYDYSKGIELVKDLNFHCRYFEESQKYIAAHSKASTDQEKHDAIHRWIEFQVSKGEVAPQPELFSREIVKQEYRPGVVCKALVTALLVGMMAFMFVQFVRICGLYVVFGKLVWHPFGRVD